jgi:hypothetical protein
VPLVEVLADLSLDFGWPPDAWRTLMVWEFVGWHRELVRRRVEAEKQSARARRDAERGR